VLFTALAAVIGAAGSLRPIKFSKAMELLEAENKKYVLFYMFLLFSL
jgi:hypothetical protein